MTTAPLFLTLCLTIPDPTPPVSHLDQLQGAWISNSKTRIIIAGDHITIDSGRVFTGRFQLHPRTGSLKISTHGELAIRCRYRFKRGRLVLGIGGVELEYRRWLRGTIIPGDSEHRMK